LNVTLRLLVLDRRTAAWEAIVRLHPRITRYRSVLDIEMQEVPEANIL